MLNFSDTHSAGPHFRFQAGADAEIPSSIKLGEALGMVGNAKLSIPVWDEEASPEFRQCFMLPAVNFFSPVKRE